MRRRRRKHGPVVGPSKPRLWRLLGPGLITGAADDDPSGIATYAQAGAQYGFALGWMMLATFPLMFVIQAISAPASGGPRARASRVICARSAHPGC